jgi:hypothetical protein
MLVLLALLANAAPGELLINGHISARRLSIESPVSWLEGGFGRLSSGSQDASNTRSSLFAQLHLALDWRSGKHFGAYLHLVGRSEPSAVRGEAGGWVEAYLYAKAQPRERDTLHFRLGTFFLPTTLEAIERPWTSPYTLTLSALNTWIGEEVRPSGLLSEYTLGLGNGDQLKLATSLFGGNDSNGALLAWRGWSMGDRLSTYREVLPLPPIESLAPGGGLEEQRDDGTRPFGSDLDGRPGWATTLAWVREGHGKITYTHYDNRGDRGLHQGEYAWRTRFDLIGLEWRPSARLTFLGETMQGDTAMGFAPMPRVAADFASHYLLASWQQGPIRFSLRRDEFSARERDFSSAGLNGDDGNAWTLAFFWEPNDRFRAGLEYLNLESRRPELARVGLDPASDGESLSLELRYYFGN